MFHALFYMMFFHKTARFYLSQSRISPLLCALSISLLIGCQHFAQSTETTGATSASDSSEVANQEANPHATNQPSIVNDNRSHDPDEPVTHEADQAPGSPRSPKVTVIEYKQTPHQQVASEIDDAAPTGSSTTTAPLPNYKPTLKNYDVPADKRTHITKGGITDKTHDLWERIRAGYQLDHSLSNKRIDLQFNWYAQNPKYLDRVFTRASRYMHHIVEQLEAHDMPLELALLPVVESAFDPFAYSHGRASGLWQFIPGTGKMYGLHQNWWYDGRRDVLASTQAAIDYLSHLVNRFDGNWLHALASYNTGSGRVAKAIRKNKKAGKPTDFWHLKLPRETRAYVPKLLAISKLVLDPAKYGISLPAIPNQSVFKVVTLESQLDLAQAANLSGLDMETLYLYNPAFNQWATPPSGPHRLVLPLENASQFETALAQLPKDQRLTWNRYSVRSGDSLIKIAKKFNTTPKVIKQVNRLRSNTIRVKQKLLIPVASKKLAYYDLSASNRLSNKQSRIAPPKNSEKVKHVVKAGDTLWDLSLKHKVSMRNIAKWNGMAPTDVLQPGKELLIYSKSTTQDTAIEPIVYAPPQREMIKKVGYRVRKGDSLARIAGKFRVRVNDLVKWNKLDRKQYLQPGQRLTIYVDITQS